MFGNLLDHFPVVVPTVELLLSSLLAPEGNEIFLLHDSYLCVGLGTRGGWNGFFHGVW